MNFPGHPIRAALIVSCRFQMSPQGVPSSFNLNRYFQLPRPQRYNTKTQEKTWLVQRHMENKWDGQHVHVFVYISQGKKPNIYYNNILRSRARAVKHVIAQSPKLSNPSEAQELGGGKVRVASKSLLAFGIVVYTWWQLGRMAGPM